MAIYSFMMKTISRSAGRSSVAAVAYVQALSMKNPRDGLVHSYRGKQKNVLLSINQGRGFSFEPDQLWPLIEQHHKRKDAVLAREIVVALPHELSLKSNAELLGRLVKELCDEHGVAVSAALHAPSTEGDARNVHAHLIYTSVDVSREGDQLQLGKKVLELDAVAMQRAKRAIPADVWRLRWQEMVNAALMSQGFTERVDCRTLAAQRDEALASGNEQLAATLDRLPDAHLGPTATAFERRTGQRSWVRLAQQVRQRLYAQFRQLASNIRISLSNIKNQISMSENSAKEYLLEREKEKSSKLVNLGKRAALSSLSQSRDNTRRLYE